VHINSILILQVFPFDLFLFPNIIKRAIILPSLFN